MRAPLSKVTKNCRRLAFIRKPLLWGMNLSFAAILHQAILWGTISIPEALAGDGQVIEISPEGEPKKYEKKIKGPTLFVWRDGDIWHVRSRTAEKKHHFSGTIQVGDGKVTKVGNFGSMEAKKKKESDIGRLNKDGDRIDFKFETKGHEDGFDFQVSKTSKTISFDLRVDGSQHRNAILIGADAQNPPQIPFTFPAVMAVVGEK